MATWSAVLWVTLTMSNTAAAQGAGSSGQPRPGSQSGCSVATSAVGSVVQVVASQLGRVPAGSLLVSAVLSSDTPAPRAQQLANLVAGQLAGRLGSSVKLHPVLLTLPAARRAARRAPALIFVRPQITAGRLLLRADGYPVPRNVWARARAPRPGPVAHGFAAARLDAEVRTSLKSIPFDPPGVRKFRGALKGTVALACGDLDGDGALDLAAVNRSHIITVRLRDGSVAQQRAARWQQLAPVAPVPLRQPLGFATIVNREPWSSESYLDVGLTDRAHSVRLDRRLQLIDKLSGIAVPNDAASACMAVDGMVLGQPIFRCHPHDPAPRYPRLLHTSDALAASRLVASDGGVRSWVAHRTQRALMIFDGMATRVLRARVGAQLALADLDQDGQPEIAASLDVLTPARDMLSVRTLLSSGRDKLRYRIAVPSGIEALTACPPDGPGRSALVLAAGNKELWVIR